MKVSCPTLGIQGDAWGVFSGRKVKLNQALVSEIGPEGPVGNGSYPEV